MVGWHHQLNGHEFEQAPRAGDGQGGLALLQSVVLEKTLESPLETLKESPTSPS